MIGLYRDWSTTHEPDEQTCLPGFLPGVTQTDHHSQRLAILEIRVIETNYNTMKAANDKTADQTMQIGRLI